MQVSGETLAKVVKSAVGMCRLVVKQTQKLLKVLSVYAAMRRSGCQGWFGEGRAGRGRGVRLTRDEGSGQIRRAEAGWNQNETGLYKSAGADACTSKTAW